MSSFDNFYTRLQSLNEARKSPVEALVPGATGVTKQMRSAGLSSAPLDTIRFIRELLFNLDVISEEELNVVKMGKGFTGKKQAMLKVLQDNQDAINAKSDEIAQTIESTLDDFISGMGANRSREEKYAAQAAAQELAAQARAAKSGKEMDDALADVISDEKLIIKASLAKAIQELEDLPGGEDISPDVLNEIKKFAPKINTIEQLESFVKQLSAMEEYQLPAAYLSSTVKAIKGGMEDIEMEDQEDPDHGFDAEKSDLDDDGKISKYERKRGEAIASSMSKEDNEGSVKREVLDACKAAAGDFAHKNSGMAFGCKQMLDQYTKAGDTERASIAKSLHDHFSGQAKHFDENAEDSVYMDMDERFMNVLSPVLDAHAEDPDNMGYEIVKGMIEAQLGRDCTEEECQLIQDEMIAVENAEDPDIEALSQVEVEELGDGELPDDYDNVLELGDKIYEVGADDPNDDGIIINIEKHPNGYFITGGVYSEPEDFVNNRENPKEGYGYAIDLQGNLMDEDDLEDRDMVKESKYTTADYLTDIYSTVEPIVASTMNENGQTTPTRQYLVEKYDEAIEDAYTSQYLTEQKVQDALPKQKKENNLSFKERFQPKTTWQLEEVRRYGL